MKFPLNFLAGAGVLTAGAGAGAGGEMTGVCTALENAIIQYFAVVANL